MLQDDQVGIKPAAKQLLARVAEVIPVATECNRHMWGHEGVEVATLTAICFPFLLRPKGHWGTVYLKAGGMVE